MINKITFVLSIGILGFVSIQAQTVTRLSQIPELTPKAASLWNKAFIQHDVIGNDFFFDQKIGMTPSERFGIGADFWKPIDGYKRTLGGVIDSIYIFWEGYDNRDLNVDIKNNNVLPEFKAFYDLALSKALREDKGAADRGLQIEIDLQLSGGNTVLLNGEHRPLTECRDENGDTIFAFGPLVFDAGHNHKPEIHPAEQLWWRRINSSSNDFFLLFACDQSDRFDDKSDYDLDLVRNGRFKPWASRPLHGSFSIPFIVSPGEKKVLFSLNVVNEKNSRSEYSDGKVHHLIFKTDTLATVIETSNVDRTKISFRGVSNTINSFGGAIIGYLIIEMEVGRGITSRIVDDDQGGYIFLNLNRTYLHSNHRNNLIQQKNTN